MTKPAPLILSILLLLAATAEVSGSDNETPAAVSKGTDAVVAKREPVRYPQRALQERIEGWVILSFVVIESGRTENITVIDSSVDGYLKPPQLLRLKNGNINRPHGTVRLRPRPRIQPGLPLP